MNISTFQISQERLTEGVYSYKVFVNGVLKESVVNTNPNTFYNVKVNLGKQKQFFGTIFKLELYTRNGMRVLRPPSLALLDHTLFV